MAKDPYYFIHDYNARNDKKISALVREFKSAGYGIYWCAAEMLHEEGGVLELDDLTLFAISKDLNEDFELVKAVIEKCVSTFKLFYFLEDNILTANRVKRNLEKRKEISKARSNAGKAGANAKQMLTNAKQMLTIDEQNQAKERKGKEIKEKEIKEITTTEVSLENNLPQNPIFDRQPNIPTKEQVWEVFQRSGGTKDMAKSFYDKYDGVGWYLGNSPITNFVSLANKFIDSWKRNEQSKNPTTEGVKIKLK